MFERETGQGKEVMGGCKTPPPVLRCCFLYKYLEFRMPESEEGRCAKNHNYVQKTCAEILKLTTITVVADDAGYHRCLRHRLGNRSGEFSRKI